MGKLVSFRLAVRQILTADILEIILLSPRIPMKNDEPNEVIFLSKGKNDKVLVWKTDGKSKKCLSTTPIENNQENIEDKFQKLIYDFQVIFSYLQIICEDENESNSSRELLYENALKLYDKWMPLIMRISEESIKEWMKKENLNEK
ncbi:MAG TPA: hypothetical protein VIH61_03265 [Waddliaceae bacterium]